MTTRIACFACVASLLAGPALADDGLIPPADRIKPDRPRLLLRPNATPLAITLDQLKAVPRDADFKQMLTQIGAEKDAACQAMVYLLTGDAAAAEKAVARMRAFKVGADPDCFAVYFGLREMALAYDWLHGYAGFTDAIKAEVRAKLVPLVEAGLRISDDHLVHNYIWQSAGGVALWAMATAGDDPAADKWLAAIRERLNDRLYAGMRYLDGAPGESMWYWALYDLSPCVMTVLAAQSAFEADLIGRIAREQDNWLARQFLHVLCNTQPDMTYVPFGDTKAGPDGGVTHEMAGILDGLTWATKSPAGAWFSRGLAAKRGPKRFYGFHGIFYFLYTRNIAVEPAEPPLAFLAGGADGGHMLARSGWTDDATVVAFRCTDHFGSHNHFDQGSFTIFRNGPLAVDPPAYRKVGGPQQATDGHSTLTIGGRGQRTVRGQSFKTLDELKANMTAGAKLDTGEVLYYFDGQVPLHLDEDRTDPRTTASIATVVGQFAQAYPDGLIASCVRQVTFIRPDRVVVIDWLTAPEGRELPEVIWQLIASARPVAGENNLVSVNNGKSHLLCWGGVEPKVEPILEKWQRVRYTYPPVEGRRERTLLHVLKVGDGPPPDRPDRGQARLSLSDRSVELFIEPGRMWLFAGPDAEKFSPLKPYAVMLCADRRGKNGP